MFHKDTLRLIKKTYKRFIAIVLIVFIGVGFMMGLVNSSNIMKESVSRYANDYNLQDVQLYSSYGFCEEDIYELKKLEVLDEIFPSKFIDAYASINNGSSDFIVRLREVNSDVNKYELVDGRNPIADDEIVICNYSANSDRFKIGDTVTLSLDEGDDILEKIELNEFKIVGVVKSPEYLSKFAGTSTLNNLDINLIGYAKNNIFKSDYYTTVYLTFNNLNEVLNYTDEYKQIVKDDIGELEAIVNLQQDYLKNDLLEDYKKEIADGEKELADKKAEGQKKLDDAKKELDDARIKLAAGEMDLESMKALIEALSEKLSISNIVGGEDQEKFDNDVKAIEEKFGSDLNTISEKVLGDYAEYTVYTSIIDSIQDETIKEQIQNSIDDINKNYIELGYADVNEAFAEIEGLETRKIALETIQNTFKESSDLFEDTTKEFEAKEIEIAKGKEEYEKGYAEYIDGLNTFNKEIEKAENDIKLAYQELDELPDAKWTILDRDSHYSSYMFENNANQMYAIGVSIPLMFCLVAALVCMTTMTRLIDEQRSSIGTFVALGYSKGQVLSKYLVYAFLASIIGSIPGVVVGNLMFPTVIYTAWRLMYDFPKMIILFPAKTVLICVFVFSVLMMSVTLFVVNKTLKEKPAQLMRPKAPKNAKKVFLEKINFIWKRLSFTSKITARNLIRYKTRFFMTVIGIAGCAGLLVIGFGIRDSISDVVDKQYGEILNYDYSINLENDDNVDDLLNLLNGDLENKYVVPFMEYYSKAYVEQGDKTIIVNVMDPRDSRNILDLKDRREKQEINVPSNGVVITEKFAKNYDVKVGDFIEIESNNGIKAKVEVKDICKWYFQHYIFMSDTYYESVFDENLHYTTIAVTTDNFDNLKVTVSERDDVNSLTDFGAFIDQFNTMIKALDIIIWVIIITAGSLAFVVLYNLTNVNISERIREIATLKVLGFREKEVNNYIFKEILILTVIGAAIGMPLGKIEENIIMSIINMENIMFGTNVYLLSYVYSFLITFVFTFIVLNSSRKPLKEVEMVESLKSVE